MKTSWDFANLTRKTSCTPRIACFTPNWFHVEHPLSEIHQPPGARRSFPEIYHTISNNSCTFSPKKSFFGTFLMKLFFSLCFHISINCSDKRNNMECLREYNVNAVKIVYIHFSCGLCLLANNSLSRTQKCVILVQIQDGRCGFYFRWCLLLLQWLSWMGLHIQIHILVTPPYRVNVPKKRKRLLTLISFPALSVVL